MKLLLQQLLLVPLQVLLLQLKVLQNKLLLRYKILGMKLLLEKEKDKLFNLNRQKLQFPLPHIELNINLNNLLLIPKVG